MSELVHVWMGWVALVAVLMNAAILAFAARLTARAFEQLRVNQRAADRLAALGASALARRVYGDDPSPGDQIREHIMGGGSFDYAYGRLNTFADELEAKLDESDGPDVEARSRLRALIAGARRVAKQMHAAEWLYSGDIGDETFIRRFDEANE